MTEIFGDSILNSTNQTYKLPSSQTQTATTGLNNILYYTFLVPPGLVCSGFTFVIVVVIMHNRRSRQSVPDGCICLLTALDIFSLLFIHLPTIGASIAGESIAAPNGLCVYQAFMTSFYLKFQFLVQVTMALDRFLAITAPLSYHRLRSFRIFKFVIATAVTVSITSSALLLIFNAGSLRRFGSWTFCIFEWRLTSTADYMVNLGIITTFLIGFLAFSCSNIALAHFLCRYDLQKADVLVRDISNAMKAEVQKTQSSPTRTNSSMYSIQKTSGSIEILQSSCGKLPATAAEITTTTDDSCRTRPAAEVDQYQINKVVCSTGSDLQRQAGNSTENDDASLESSPILRTHAVGESGEIRLSSSGRVQSVAMFDCDLEVTDDAMKEIDGNPLETLICHGYAKHQLNDKGPLIATEVSDQYEATIGKTAIGSGQFPESIVNQQQQQQQQLQDRGLRLPETEVRQASCENQSNYVRLYSKRETPFRAQVQPPHIYRTQPAACPLTTADNLSHDSNLELAQSDEICHKSALLRKCVSLSLSHDHQNSEDNNREAKKPKRIISNNFSLPPLKHEESREPLTAAARSSVNGQQGVDTTSEKITQSMLCILERIRNLLERSKRNARRHNRQLLLLKCISFCGLLFVLTWLPYTVSSIWQQNTSPKLV